MLAAATLIVLIFFFVSLAVLGILRSTLSMKVPIPTEIMCWFFAGYLAVFGIRLWRGERRGDPADSTQGKQGG